MKLGKIPQFKFILFFLIIVFILVVLILGIFYWQKVRKPSTLEESVLPTTEEMVAKSYIDVFLAPGERKVGYFVVGQKFTLTENQVEDWIQVIESNSGNELWIEKRELL